MHGWGPLLDILIAEDEKDITFMYTKLLEERGHTVTVTYDGQECLDVYYDKAREAKKKPLNPNEHADAFDAVILDHKLPKLDGFQAAKEIISINPRQRIIMASAYSNDIFEEAAEHFQISLDILQKPFSRSALLDLLEKSGRSHH